MFEYNSTPIYLHLNTVNSTNQWVKENLKKLNTNCLTCFSSKLQTDGKGRFAKKWHSPSEGNIYASFHFVSPQKNLENLAQIAGLSLCKTLHSLDFEPQFKWPNDIFIQEKKVSGVLCEIFTIDHQTHAVIGIGLNVNMRKESLQEVSQVATSLQIESGKSWNEKNILKQLTLILQANLALYFEHSFQYFLNEINQYLLHKNKEINVLSEGKKYTGVLRGIDEKGFLEILVENENEKKIYSFSSCEFID